MPEYMTKCEPVDKKPYIVYTDEKGILYSGDPDSDIPGGGGGETVKVYIVNDDDRSTAFPVSWITATNANTNEEYTINEDSIIIEGNTIPLDSFEAYPGALIHLVVDGGDEGFYQEGSIAYFDDFDKTLPANGEMGDLRYLEFVMPDMTAITFILIGK